MSYDYDKLYGTTPDALGKPTKIFVDFFDSFAPKQSRVLDIGCGQGRDALFIARKGHSVVGVDISANGIGTLCAVAEREHLPIEGVVADVTTYQPDGVFDVVLIDRTLHMLDVPDQLSVLERLLNHVAKGGWLLIADEASNIPAFKDVIRAHSAKWHTDFARKGYLFLSRL